ncbi:MAG: hydroxyacid dehydrogenase [Planctomycetes bacterium]|nr:hydroxyacid dehydrogenase [Planctomycetota bacterium]
MSETFHVGVTRDFLGSDGTFSYGENCFRLLDEASDVEWEFLADKTAELRPDQIQSYDALLLLIPRITAATLEGADRLKVIARFGVGYDTIDVEACTQAGVMLTITPDGIRQPVAASVMTFMLALSHKLFLKDKLTRAGRWNEKLDHMGMGLTGRTLGVIGYGNIGREVFRLARPFGMHHLAYDPYVNEADSADTDVTLTDLETLLKTSDFVSICCQLTPETRHLINAERLALMKPTSYLINMARGPVVDQKALTQVLQERKIQGAGLDVFEQEPIDPDDPILKLDNVIVTPHGICWTDEAFSGNGRSACESILDIAAGRIPQHVVNRDVLESARFKEKTNFA